MSNQPSSSSNSAPATPSSSKPQGKTQVFILTPDLLKKLGIASKIPSLTAAKSSATVATPKSSIIIKNNINVADTTKNKLASSLNKKINDSNETTNILKTCSKDLTKQNEKEKDSVKTKLLSMLTSKLEKEKSKSTSSSLETKNDKHTNIKIQIDPKKGNNIIEIETIKSEPDSNINKLCKNDIKTNLNEINTKHDSVQNINESVENIQSIKIAQPNTKENTHRDIKPSLQSATLIKNTLIQEIKSEIQMEYGNVPSTDDAEKYITHDKIKSKETNESIETPSEIDTNTATSEQRKRKISEENSEDSESVSPIRKSARKRKLSTLHSDYVTELKLHDGSSQKLPNKNKKSIEMKSSECPKQNVPEDITDLNENNSIKLENSASTNEPENMEQNNETKVADMEETQDAEKIDKSCRIDQNLTNNVLLTPVHNIRIITNNESNNNVEQLLTTGSVLSISTNNTELNKRTDGNAVLSPKKQIIIHENILIKSPKSTTISNLNIELTNQESAKTTSIKKLEFSNSNVELLARNEASVIDANLDFKLPVLETCSEKTKRKLSTDAQPKPILETQKPELTAISTPEVHQNKDEITEYSDVSNKTSVIDTVTKISETSVKAEINKNLDITSDANCTPVKNAPDQPKIDTVDNINKSPVEKPSTQETKQETKAPSTIDVEICSPIKNTPDQPKLDSNNSPVDKPSTQEIKLESKSPQTIVLVRRRRSRPGRDNSGANASFLMQENNSANLSDFESFYSSVTSNTNENSLLPHSNTTTPVKQIRSIQDSEMIHLSPTTETNTSQNTTKESTKTNPVTSTPIYKCERQPKQENSSDSVNDSKLEIHEKILTDTEIKTPAATPIRRRGRKPKEIKNRESVNIFKTETVETNPNVKQDELSKSETKSILSNSKTTPISTPIYKIERQPKQETTSDSVNVSRPEILENLLTNTDIETPVTTPIRRKGRKPREIKNRESVNISETETVETNPNAKQDELSKSETTTIPVRRRGRPAKEKKNLQCSEIVTNKPTEEETTPVKQKRAGRKKTVAVVEKVEQNEEKSTKVKAKYMTPPTRGRKRDRQEMMESASNTKSKEITCAVCKEVLQRAQWSLHTLKHNFLCWKVGEPELNLNDRKTVEYVLFKGLKENSKFKHFSCPTCSDKKKSVLGFLSHLDICQLTEEERLAMMEACTICSKKVMPQSMKSHMKIHENYLGKGGIHEQEVEEDLSQRSKRKAATKAANLIQEVSNEEDAPVIKRNAKPGYKKGLEAGSVFMSFGIIKKIQADFKKGSNKCKFKQCKFQCDNFDEMKEHLNACPTIKNDDYICRYCLYIDNNENKMKEHIIKTHLVEKEDYKSDASASDSEDDDYFDDEINQSGDDTNNLKGKKLSKPSSEYIKPTFKIGFLARERRIIRDPVCSYLPALRWTLEFCEENYSKVLFENIKCLASKWIAMPLNEQEKYMPLVKKSMSVKSCSIANKIPNFQRQEHDWKEYDLYETSLDNDTVTIFCGGPIWAIAWVPTPADLVCDQYLAVSVQKDFEATYKISESLSGHEVIQFWNFGPLQSKVPLKNTPILEFSIAHNHGMVWCMEWCASGYYDTNDRSESKELRKLGLLALACCDGNIPIYAIGIPKAEQRNKNNIFDIKPAFKLILQEPLDELLGRWKYQATKVSWSKSSGHNVIAGGYSNGIVCLWDLENTSPLLRSEEEGVIVLKPYLSFQAHTSAISALVLYPLVDEGKRWLLTGSWDRTFKYWDLNNISAPISTFGKRGIVTDGVWISHWLCSFFAFDDVFSLGHTVTTVQNPRDFGFKQCSALASNSVVMSLSASEWVSAIAQGTLAGELTTTFPRTILISYDVDKHLKCKRMMLSYNEIIDKTKDASERKDIMKTEKKQEKNFNEKDDNKLFAWYLEDKDSEPYVEEPHTYDKVQQKYGMLFCDFNLKHFHLLPTESLDAVKQSARLREVPTEMYPFTSLNRLVWNPNKQAYLYVACGYQNGFVRLRCVRFMNAHQQ